jgi:sugar phosphate isomerase/epimerase
MTPQGEADTGLSRRAFLRAGAAGVGGAMALHALGQEAKPGPPPFQFSTSTIMYWDSPLEVALEEVAKTGCQAVDIWEAPDAPEKHMEWVELRRPAYLRSLVESFGLKLFAFSIYWSPGNKRLQRLEWLAEAGGQVAVLGGGAGEGQPVSAGIDALKPLVERAEALGLRIAGENHSGSSLHTVASLREFASLAQSPALGIALAPYHVMIAQEPVPEAVKACGPKLFFFYAWQQAPGMQELPGDGTLDFRPVLASLREVGYRGYLNIFTHTHVPKDQMTAGIIAARKYLEQMAAPAP